MITMNQKKFVISQLYDYYGELLKDKQKYAVEMYYNDDLSLSEIAESIGITRQGVRDQLRHAEDFLLLCESKLGFADKLGQALLLAEQIKNQSANQDISAKVDKIIDLLS